MAKTTYKLTKPGNVVDETWRQKDLSDAMYYLKEAAVKAHDAPKTAARIDLAISSLRGAIRNAGYRVDRARRLEKR